MRDGTQAARGEPPAGWAAVRAYFLEPIRGEDSVGRRAGIRRWRRTAGIWLVYLGYPLAELFHRGANPARVALGVALLAAFCWLYVVPLPRAMFARPNRDRALVLAGGPAVMALYLVFVGRGGLVLPVFVSVMLAVLVIPAISLPLIVLMAAAVTWLPQYVPAWHLHGAQWSTSGPIALVVLALYVVRAGARGQIELAEARQEIARLAQEQERLRISRDLHDLLGHALTTITVKAELASKLAARDPDRAAAEMAQVAALGREGLADVRAAVAGYRQVSLVTELAAAREVLTAAGIRAELPAAVEDVPVGLRELFGWALREGVTNAVRHSGAATLRVAVTRTSIEITDDGAGGAAPAGHRAARAGSGLTGLAQRVAAAGGRLETGPARAGGAGFRLRVVVPA